MLPHAVTSGMCDLHVRWGDQWIVSGLQRSNIIIVQEVFVAISNFSLFRVKLKLIPTFWEQLQDTRPTLNGRNVLLLWYCSDQTKVCN